MADVCNIKVGNKIVSGIDFFVFLSIFRESYGNRYLGDEIFLNDYIYRADKIVKLGDVDNLRAVALIRNSRITAVATVNNRELFGRRYQLM